MQVTVIGAGEAFDSGLGNNCFLLNAPRARTVLIDCGYQIPERLWSEDLHQKIDGIYFTHTHADHAFGVVPLIARYWEEGRTRPLHILGHRGVESYVNKILDLGYPGFKTRLRFPLEFHKVNVGRTLSWGGYEVNCARSAHGVMNLSVRFERGGRSCAFSGDGALTEETAALYKDVDTLFHELFAVRRDIPGHTNLTSLRRRAAEIRPGRIVVSHHARRYKASVLRAVERLNDEQTREPKAGPAWISAKPGQLFDI